MNRKQEPRWGAGHGTNRSTDKTIISQPDPSVNPLVHIILTGRDLLVTRQWLEDYERGGRHDN